MKQSEKQTAIIAGVGALGALGLFLYTRRSSSPSVEPASAPLPDAGITWAIGPASGGGGGASSYIPQTSNPVYSQLPPSAVLTPYGPVIPTPPETVPVPPTVTPIPTPPTTPPVIITPPTPPILPPVITWPLPVASKPTPVPKKPAKGLWYNKGFTEVQ